MQGSRVAAANRPGLKFPLRQLGMVSDACPKGVKHSTSRLQRLRDGRNTRVDGMNGIDRMPGVTEPGSIIQTASAEMCWILRSRQASLRTSWIANMSPVYGQRTALFFFLAAALSAGSVVGEDPRACVYSPRILASGIADTYSLRTFAQFDRWRNLAGDAKAYEVYRYLADTQTGLFHMNVVAEGEDALSEFVVIRDPVKILNVYGYAYCGILGPTMAGICEGIGLGPARTVVLPGWNHVAAETYYDNQWHYLDLDVRAVFRRDDGRLASLDEARTDPTLWHDQGPLFFPNDPLDATRAIYEMTAVEPYFGFQQAGHTMDFVLRPGERLTRWWRPQGGRWHHLPEYNDQPWLRH